MTEEADESVRQFLNDGGNWERKATNIPGAFLWKLVYTFLNLGRDILNTRIIIMNIRDYIGLHQMNFRGIYHS